MQKHLFPEYAFESYVYEKPADIFRAQLVNLQWSSDASMRQ